METLWLSKTSRMGRYWRMLSSSSDGKSWIWAMVLLFDVVLTSRLSSSGVSVVSSTPLQRSCGYCFPAAVPSSRSTEAVSCSADQIHADRMRRQWKLGNSNVLEIEDDYFSALLNSAIERNISTRKRAPSSLHAAFLGGAEYCQRLPRTLPRLPSRLAD